MGLSRRRSLGESSNGKVRSGQGGRHGWGLRMLTSVLLQHGRVVSGLPRAYISTSNPLPSPSSSCSTFARKKQQHICMLPSQCSTSRYELQNVRVSGRAQVHMLHFPQASQFSCYLVTLRTNIISVQLLSIISSPRDALNTPKLLGEGKDRRWVFRPQMGSLAPCGSQTRSLCCHRCFMRFIYFYLRHSRLINAENMFSRDRTLPSAPAATPGAPANHPPPPPLWA